MLLHEHFFLESRRDDKGLQMLPIGHGVQDMRGGPGNGSFDSGFNFLNCHLFFLNHSMISDDSYSALPSITRHGTWSLPPILTSSSRKAGLAWVSFMGTLIFSLDRKSRTRPQYGQ